MTEYISPATAVSVRRRVCVGAVLAAVMSAALVQAQEPAWTAPHALKLTPSRALALVTAAQRDLSYVPGEVLVKFKAGVTRNGQQRALQAIRSQPRVGDLRWLGDVAVLRDAREQDATVLAAQLSEQPEVQYAEPNRLHRMHAVPNDPGFSSSQWNMTAIDMPRAWDINAGATSDLTVAVLDSGITTTNVTYTFPSWDGRLVRTVSVPFRTNPDLGAARLTKPKDFAFWDGPVLDMDGHGTHVGATIGEDTNNNVALAGIAYNASIMPLKVCVGYWEVQFILSASGYNGFAPADVGGCPEDATIAAVRYAADNGAKIMNMSIGSEGESRALREAIEYAVSKGVFVAIAVGNEFEEGNPVEYPAADAAEINGAMSVAAVGRSLERSHYSNTGDWIEIAAPGGDARADGADGVVWQASLSSVDFDPHTTFSPRFDRYYAVGLQGTSMATPHVAGTAALLFSQGVTNPAAIEALIKKTAKDLGESGRDDEYGAGLIQPRAALIGLGVAR